MRRTTAAAAALALLFTACGGDDGGSDASVGGDFCNEVTVMNDSFDSLEGDAMPFDDPDALEEMFTAAVEGIQNVSERAPDSLEDDFAVLNDAYGRLLDALKDADFDFMAVAGDTELAELMDSTAVADAQDNVSAYVLDECGIDLDDTGSSTDDTVAPDSQETTAPDEGASDTLPGSDVSIPMDGTAREQIVALYQQMFGLDEDQAGCLADALIELGGAEAATPTDINEVMSLFADCDIDPSQLGG